MSNPHARKGRHAAPARPTGRRLAVAAAAIAAGAVPLACAGTAAAATPEAAPPQTTAPEATLPPLGLPDLPLGLPNSIGPMTQGLPLAQDLPVSDVVGGVTPPLDDVVQVGDFGGLLSQAAPAAAAAPAVRAAQIPQSSAISADAANLAFGATGLATTAGQALTEGVLTSGALTDGAQRTAQRLTAALPVSPLAPELASTSAGPLQLAPNVLRDGAIGTLASGITPQTRDLTGGLVGQATPLVSQLRQTGVPTVGDVTGSLSTTQLPVVGTVGSLTQTLPVTTLLGTSSPVTGALQNLSGL